MILPMKGGGSGLAENLLTIGIGHLPRIINRDGIMVMKML